MALWACTARRAFPEAALGVHGCPGVIPRGPHWSGGSVTGPILGWRLQGWVWDISLWDLHCMTFKGSFQTTPRFKLLQDSSPG